MEQRLKDESERLVRSWMRHHSAMLRDYLVAGVEDPRLNVQSVLTRHFLARLLAGDRFGLLMDEEYRFAAAMNWLMGLISRLQDPSEVELVLHALRRGADNAEGMEIPHYLLQIFSALPGRTEAGLVPNYIESFLTKGRFPRTGARAHEPSLNTFRNLWRKALRRSQATRRRGASAEIGGKAALPTVLEPACGSANDYRVLHAYGLAQRIAYTGFDLCAKNIENAQALFPGVRFETGNVFAIAAPDKAFDVCFVHDLFEHLSPEGLEAGAREVCRVTRHGLCLGFFNMDEIPEHQVRPVDEYHWNLLSMRRMKQLFAGCGFSAQVVHIGTFLRQQVGCGQTHNPNAYTFFLRRDQ